MPKNFSSVSEKLRYLGLFNVYTQRERHAEHHGMQILEPLGTLDFGFRHGFSHITLSGWHK